MIDRLIQAQDWQAAREEAESLEKILRRVSGDRLTEMHDKILSLLKTTIWPRYYETQAVLVSRRLEEGDIEGAYQLGSKLLEELAEPKAAELANTARSLQAVMNQQVRPAWYAAKGYWLDKGKLYSWDKEQKRVMPVFSAGPVDQYEPSPDLKRVAVRSLKGLWVVNRDGTRATNLDNDVEHIYGWVGAESLRVKHWNSGYSIKLGIYALNEQNASEGFAWQE